MSNQSVDRIQPPPPLTARLSAAAQRTAAPKGPDTDAMETDGEPGGACEHPALGGGGMEESSCSDGPAKIAQCYSQTQNHRAITPRTGDGASAEDDKGFALLLDHAACRAAPRLLMATALEATAALTAPGGGFLPSAVNSAVAAAATAPGATDAGRQAAAALLRAAARGSLPGRSGGWGARVQWMEARCATKLPWIRELLGHNDSAVRAGAARLLGAAAFSMLPRGSGGGSGVQEVEALLSQLLAAGCGPEGGAGADGGSGKAGASSKLEEQEGCILAAGGLPLV